MSDDSPLFISSLELIAHATELFAEEDSRKYKFVILHLANAIELILKDCVIDQGTSIYVGKSTKTIGVWDCVDKLKGHGINIPEMPVIELLIDDRNNIQHRFGHPNVKTVYYYISKVVKFLQRFLDDHYKVQLSEALKPHLSEEHLKLLGLVVDQYDYLDKLAGISIEAGVVQAFNVVEQQLRELLGDSVHGSSSLIWRNKNVTLLLEDLERMDYLSKDGAKLFGVLREARNYAAHSAEAKTSTIKWETAFNIAKGLISGLQKAKRADYKFVPINESDNATNNP